MSSFRIASSLQRSLPTLRATRWKALTFSWRKMTSCLIPLTNGKALRMRQWARTTSSWSTRVQLLQLLLNSQTRQLIWSQQHRRVSKCSINAQKVAESKLSKTSGSWYLLGLYQTITDIFGVIGNVGRLAKRNSQRVNLCRKYIIFASADFRQQNLKLHHVKLLFLLLFWISEHYPEMEQNI